MDARFGGAFNSPVEGFPVYIEKEKTGPQIFNVEYKVRYSNTETVRIAETDSEIQQIIDSAPNVWEFVSEDYQWKERGTLYTNPQLRAILQGADKQLFRTANGAAMEEHGFVPDDTGIEEWNSVLQGDHFIEEATFASSSDRFETMSKKELAEECKKRNIRTSVRWTASDYVTALTVFEEDDIPH